MRAQVDELEDTISALVLKLRANSKRLDRLEAGDLGDLGIDALIDRKLDETIAMRAGAGLGRRPDMEALGDRLGLDGRQRQQITSLLDKAKARVYDVMAADMGDGRDMMDSMLETMRGKGSREDKTRKVLSDMFNQNVPGSDDSYFSTLMDIRTSSVSGFQQILTPEQLASFKSLNIDFFGIQTGYSPFSEELQQVLAGGQ
jgi:Spy/CpxP family protein refolding chaperone